MIRAFKIALAFFGLLVASIAPADAQQAQPSSAATAPTATLNGTWKYSGAYGQPMTITITGVRPSGKLDGKISFDRDRTAHTFADTASKDGMTATASPTADGVVITTAFQSTFMLKLVGDKLIGVYRTVDGSREGAVDFKRS